MYGSKGLLGLLEDFAGVGSACSGGGIVRCLTKCIADGRIGTGFVEEIAHKRRIAT